MKLMNTAIIVVMSLATCLGFESSLQSAAIKELPISLNVNQGMDAYFLAVYIFDNEPQQVEKLFNSFVNELITFQDKPAALTLLNLFYEGVLEALKNIGDIQLDSLQNRAGKQFANLLEMSTKKLQAIKEPSPAPQPAAPGPFRIPSEQARTIRPEEIEKELTRVFLQETEIGELDKLLPTLPLEQIKQKLIGYINQNELTFAQEIINYLEKTYMQPSDTAIISDIYRSLLSEANRNDTFEVIEQALLQLFQKLSQTKPPFPSKPQLKPSPLTFVEPTVAVEKSSLLNLEELKRQLPHLKLEEIKQLLIGYIKKGAWQHALEVVSYLEKNYQSDTDTQVISNILATIENANVFNDTYLRVFDRLHRHYMTLIYQKRPPFSSSQIKKRLSFGQAALTDLEALLPTLDIEGIKQKLIEFYKDGKWQNADVIINYLRATYQDPAIISDIYLALVLSAHGNYNETFKYIEKQLLNPQDKPSQKAKK